MPIYNVIVNKLIYFIELATVILTLVYSKDSVGCLLYLKKHYIDKEQKPNNGFVL